MIIVRIVLVVCVIVATAYFYMRYLEKKSLYYPTREMEGTPAVSGLDYKDVFFTSGENITLHGWFVPAEGARCTVLFFHGNGGNISHRLGKIDFFYRLGINTFIVDYRGYGQSNGSPGEAGFYEDAAAAYRYLRDVLKQDCIIVYGESLGGAVAVDLAAREKIAGLILEGTFTREADMARIIYPWLPPAVLAGKFDSLSKISGIKVPKLHLHALGDDIVPFSLGKQLYDSAGEPKTLIALEGGHNDAFFVSEEKVRAAINSFIAGVIKENR